MTAIHDLVFIDVVVGFVYVASLTKLFLGYTPQSWSPNSSMRTDPVVTHADVLCHSRIGFPHMIRPMSGCVETTGRSIIRVAYAAATEPVPVVMTVLTIPVLQNQISINY